MGYPSSSRTGSEEDDNSRRNADTHQSAPAQPSERDANVKRASNVSFPSVVHIGRHLDGDTDEISVIVCTQRTRRRWNGELPRCYTFGWRHVGTHEVQTPIPLPPKFGQEKEVAGYWKERLIGTRKVGEEGVEDVTWTGVDMEDEDEEPVRPLIGLVDKRENWKEGNYVSYGTGSTSALEKIQGMHVPLHAYDAHRKAREDLWSAERVAQNMAKHQAKLLKQQIKMEEKARRAQAISEGTSASTSASMSGSSGSSSTRRVAPLTRAAPTVATGELESSAQPSSSSTSPSSSHAGPSGLSSSGSTRTTTATQTQTQTPTQTTSAKGIPVEPMNEAPKRSSPQTPPALPPAKDKRFGPEKIPYVPWYRRWTNYRPSPTGWTADEDHGHRSYIVPHPFEAVKNNLQRSWSAVFTPTWKLVKALRVSYASGAQTQIWRDAWRFSIDGEQTKLLERANRLFKEQIQRERERLDQERNNSKNENDRSGNS